MIRHCAETREVVEIQVAETDAQNIQAVGGCLCLESATKERMSRAAERAQLTESLFYRDRLGSTQESNAQV